MALFHLHAKTNLSKRVTTMATNKTQSPITPVRMDAELKERCQLAAAHDGFDSLSSWIKVQCQRRINELHDDKRFLIKLDDLPY